MSSPKYPDLANFVRDVALQRGKFVLTSGATSDYYLDGKLINFDPKGIALTVEAIRTEIEDLALDAVGGMDMGATPIVSAFALRSFQLGNAIPTFVVRKQVKEHGTAKPIEGPLPASARVAIIDDVVSTGGSIIKAIVGAREAGCKVLAALAIVDRNLGAHEALAELGVEYRPLVTLADLGIE